MKYSKRIRLVEAATGAAAVLARKKLKDRNK